MQLHNDEVLDSSGIPKFNIIIYGQDSIESPDYPWNWNQQCLSLPNSTFTLTINLNEIQPNIFNKFDYTTIHTNQSYVDTIFILILIFTMIIATRVIR